MEGQFMVVIVVVVIRSAWRQDRRGSINSLGRR